jgi:hypothetical protein
MEINRQKLLWEYEKKIQNYEKVEYKFEYDLFYLTNIYKYFNKWKMTTFINLMRYFSKIFQINEKDLIVLKLNLNLILSPFTPKTCIFKCGILKEIEQEKKYSKINLLNLIFLFINSKLVTETEDKLAKGEKIRIYVNQNLMTNFVENFNNWCISRRFAEMNNFIISKEIERLLNLRIKTIKMDKIYSISDVKTRDLSMMKSDSVNKDKIEIESPCFFEEKDTDENEQIDRFFNRKHSLKLDNANSLVLDNANSIKLDNRISGNSNFFDSHKFYRMDSSNSLDNVLGLMKNKLSRNYSNTSGFFGANYNF